MITSPLLPKAASTIGCSRAAVGVLVLAALAGCSSSSSARPLDASTHHDASGVVDGGDDAAGDDASDDGGDEAADDGGGDDSGFDASGVVILEAGGPPQCRGPSDCTEGRLCCLDVAAERAPATCVTSTACPSGNAELCGLNGTEKCHSGMCQDYECTDTQPHLVVTFFACGVPPLPTVSCGVTTPPSPDAGTGG